VTAPAPSAARATRTESASTATPRGTAPREA
jgi:hypothetical protein